MVLLFSLNLFLYSFGQFNAVEYLGVIGANIGYPTIVDRHLDGLANAKLVIYHSFEGKFSQRFFPPRPKPTSEPQCCTHHHGLLAFLFLCLLAFFLLSPDDDVVVLLDVEAGEVRGWKGGLCIGCASGGRVGSFIVCGGVCLSGDVVLKVGPDGFLIIELIYDFPCLLDGFDDELDLIIQVIDLLYLYLEHVVLEYFLTALGVASHAFLQFHQSQLCLHEPLDPHRIVLEICQFKLQFFVFLPQQQHLFCEGNVLFHFVVYADVQLLVLASVNAVVLDKHEHVAPAMLLIPPQLLVLTLKALELCDVLPLDSDGVVLKLIADLSVGIFQGIPVCVESAHQVLKYHLQQQALFHAFLPGELNQLLETGDDDLLFFLAELPWCQVLHLKQLRYRLGEPIENVRVLGPFLRGVERPMCAWYFEQRGEDVGDILVCDPKFKGVVVHGVRWIIFCGKRENRIVLYFHYLKMYSQLNVVGDHPHIPEEAFLFVPNRAKDVQTRDDFRIGEGKGLRRLLFEGWAVETYTPYELEKMKEFQDYLKRKNIELDPRWDRSWRMRFLLSTGCNIKKCIADMEIFIKYQNSVRELSFTKHVAKYIREGVFYVSGRDSHYRPILVFDVDKIIKSEMSEDELIEAQTYFFEYVMRNFLIPGQVENWVSIIDANFIGVFSLVSSMKRSFTFLSDTYRSRMFVCYVVRIPTSLSFVWSVVKRFLEEETVKKINFFDDQTIEPLLQFCNPSQLEKKFGGSLENIAEGHFWPPREVSKVYKCEKEPTKLLTKQQYTEYYSKKILYETKFHEENLIPTSGNGKGDERRDNANLHTIKKIEREFKIELQMLSQDTINFESDVKPYSSLRQPLNFITMLQTSSKTKSQIQ